MRHGGLSDLMSRQPRSSALFCILRMTAEMVMSKIIFCVFEGR